MANPDQLLEILGIEATHSVADVGTINGYFTLPLAKLVASNIVYAINIDSRLLATLREKGTDVGLENIFRIKGDTRNLDALLLDSVDVILVTNISGLV